MKNIIFPGLITFWVFAGVCFGQGKVVESFTTYEPATVSLEALFGQADLVAFVRIHSGDSESYKRTIYRAEVLTAYKGAKEKEIIYFGPFIGYGVGSEYLIFLKKTTDRIGGLTDEEIKPNQGNYDTTQNYYSIMYDGYSIMPVDFECFFDGEKTDNNCDYGVRFNIKQVKLPPRLKTFPKDVGEFSDNKKWVRRSLIEETLRGLKKSSKK